MTKLCYKSNGTVKEYDLKDNVSRVPKLGVKVNGATKYLGLKQGTKSGELTIRLNGLPYYIQTWGPDDSLYWNLDAAPERGCGGTRGDDTHGGCAVWTLKNSEGYLVAAVGRIAADRPDNGTIGIWTPNKGGLSNINTNTHAGYNKPYIRLCTIAFGMFYEGKWLPVNTAANIYSHLLNSKYTSSTPSYTCYESKCEGILNPIIQTSHPSQKLYSYGYEYRNSLLTDEQVAAGLSYVKGPTNLDNAEILLGFSVGKESTTGLPKISVSGVLDDGGKRYLTLQYVPYGAYCKWGVRDFYIEWPQVQKLEFTPKQVLDAWKTILQEAGTWETNFGTCYGRNY